MVGQERHRRHGQGEGKRGGWEAKHSVPSSEQSYYFFAIDFANSAATSRRSRCGFVRG